MRVINSLIYDILLNSIANFLDKHMNPFFLFTNLHKFSPPLLLPIINRTGSTSGFYMQCNIEILLTSKCMRSNDDYYLILQNRNRH